MSTRELRRSQFDTLGLSYIENKNNFIVEDSVRIAPVKNRWCFLKREHEWFGFDDLKDLLNVIKTGD